MPCPIRSGVVVTTTRTTTTLDGFIWLLITRKGVCFVGVIAVTFHSTFISCQKLTFSDSVCQNVFKHLLVKKLNEPQKRNFSIV